MPPTPSWLCATGSIIFGTKPPTSVPVVSVRYLPTVPLELAGRVGNDAHFARTRRRDGAISAFVDEKCELVLQPRLHCPQKSPFARPLSGCVRIDSRDGTHVTLRRLAASMTSSS